MLSPRAGRGARRPIRRLVLLLGLVRARADRAGGVGLHDARLRPLARLRAGAARVSGDEDLTRRPPTTRPGRGAPLAGTLNEMLARLDASTRGDGARAPGHAPFRRRRRPRAADAADRDAGEPRHARTQPRPAADERARWWEMPAEQPRIVALLEGLQALARGEAAESVPREDVELGDWSTPPSSRAPPPPGRPLRARGRHRRRHRRRLGGRPAPARRQPARQRGDPRPAAAPSRSASSAGRHAACGSTTTAPGCRRTSATACCSRSRAGAPRGRAGTGLGLAIVAQQAALHGGELHLDDSRLGGLGVGVRLPASADEDPA